ncbi:MAG: hypothetical protein DRN71_00935 [Candidatus Nanohalarchaeota archaeon]|nr:MAG: hypothetical protein DRN71_00935 [Candidatus Nanohaloarchaeota archaeon]
MALKEIQDKTSIFRASNDVLCIGLSAHEINYLSGIKVDAVIIDNRKGKENISERFNMLVIGLDISVFHVFGILEKYVDALLSNSKILLRVKVDVSLEDAKNMIAQLSKSLKLQPETYVTTSKNDVWLILSRIHT